MLLRGGLLVMSVLLTACAGSINKSDYASLKANHSFALINDVPYFPQTEDQCGPSSLATMLGFRGIHVTPESLRQHLYIPQKKGAVTTEMSAHARRYGLLVYPLEADVDSLLAELDAGNPVLILQNLGFDWMPKWHFSVVIGYDLQKRVVILRSGADYFHEVDMALFIKTWNRAENWGLVMTEPEQLPRTARLEVLLKAALALEQVSETQTALRLYQSILSKWPDQPTALFGAGNAAYALAKFNESHLFFRRYIDVNPNAAEGWNNLAYSFSAQGCVNQALKVINCGLAASPKNTVLLESLGELQLIKTAGLGECPIIVCNQ